MATTLCGARRTLDDVGVTVYCTRPAGHAPDEHIAAIGPAEPGAAILARWPVVDEPREPDGNRDA